LRGESEAEDFHTVEIRSEAEYGLNFCRVLCVRVHCRCKTAVAMAAARSMRSDSLNCSSRRASRILSSALLNSSTSVRSCSVSALAVWYVIGVYLLLVASVQRPS
jgi:hypothetical protein